MIAGLLVVGMLVAPGKKAKLDHASDVLRSIEAWMDTSLVDYDDVYDRHEEIRYQRERRPEPDVYPTFYASPFYRERDWC